MRLLHLSLIPLLMAGMLAGADHQQTGQEPGAVAVSTALGGLLDRFAEGGEDDGVDSRRPVKRVRGWLGEATHTLPAGFGPPSATTRTIQLQVPLTTPVCVLGIDAVSKRWLVINREALTTLGAHCVLIEAASESIVRELTALAHPVPVHPLPFADIAALHGIDAYPVLLMGKSPQGGVP